MAFKEEFEKLALEDLKLVRPSLRENPEAFKEYRKKEQELRDKLKSLMYKELDILEEPGREHIFEKAWQEGRSSGWNDVYFYLMDFVDMIREVDKARAAEK